MLSARGSAKTETKMALLSALLRRTRAFNSAPISLHSSRAQSTQPALDAFFAPDAQLPAPAQTPAQPPTPPIDTWRFVSRLEPHLSPGQPDALLAVLRDALSSTQLETAVSKSEFDRTHYAQYSQIHELDASMTRVVRTESEKMRGEIASSKAHLGKLNNKLREEIQKLESSARLEISLEKGRIRDAHAAEELKISEAEGKIEQEFSNFETGVEGMKWELFRTIVPLVTATGGLLIGYLRLMR